MVSDVLLYVMNKELFLIKLFGPGKQYQKWYHLILPMFDIIVRVVVWGPHS